MKTIKGLIFDYGGTIDTPAVHWSEVLWEGYGFCSVPVTKAQFREAYVHGERTLATQPLIRPEHDFHQLLLVKVDVEMAYLVEKGWWTPTAPELHEAVLGVADYCYDYVLKVLEINREVLRVLSTHFPLVLVSNFYGNIHTILKDFRLDDFFNAVIESAVVGVRKPNPEIFNLGVKALGLPAEEVLVVGDSFDKDMVPASSLGCQTLWLKGVGWESGDAEAETRACQHTGTTVIHSLPEVLGLLQL